MNEELPESVGPYRIEARVGAGGMGVVYRAYDQRLERRVAVKHILRGHEDDARARARFRLEAKTAAGLSHPAIVQVHDILETEEGDWIVMELVKGSTVAELLRGKPLALEHILRIGTAVAEGLAEAHEQGIVHRDLKAENVMVTPAGHAKILDFGLAKGPRQGEDESGLTAAGTIVGTRRCMSPEQARGFEIDARSDLFSFGILLYEMATGEQPFQGATPSDTLARICTYQPPPVHEKNTEVSSELSAVVESLLEKLPEWRPASAAEVGEKLAALARNNSSAVLMPPGPTESVAAAALESTLDAEVLTMPAALGEAPAAERTEAHAATESPRQRSPVVTGTAAAVTALITVGLFSAYIVRRIDQADPQDSGEGPPTVYDLYQEGQHHLRAYYRPGSLDEATKAFQRILAQDDKSAPAYAGLAATYWRRYRAENRDEIWLDHALSHAERAVELNKHLAAARVSLGFAFVSLGQLDDADEQFRQVLVVDPRNADSFRGLAEIHESRGELEEAAKAYQEAIRSRPDDFELYNRLGHNQYRLARYDEAEASFLKCIELASDFNGAYRNLGGVYYIQGRLDEAAAEMQKALAIEPDVTLYSSLGVIYFSQGFYQQAIQAFEQAVEMPGGANHYLAWINLADAYRHTPDNETRAENSYRAALRLLLPLVEKTPEDTDLQSRLALLWAKLGEEDQAVTALTLVKRGNGSSWAAFRSAIAYEILGARAEALDRLGEAMSLGFSLAEIEADPELIDLRTDARYHRMLLEREKARATPQP